MNILTSKINEIEFEYFQNDYMAQMCVGTNVCWEPHISKFVTLYNGFYSIQNIIDVGANFGYHTIFFSKEVKHKVFAFEPQIQNYQLLENNIKKNEIQNVVLYKLACGDENCDIKMPIVEDSTTMINMGDFTPNRLINDKFSVTQSVLLDEMEFFEEPIDLIKIDVQGYEKKVLIGAYHLLQKHKPTLIVEFEGFQLAKTNTSCKELFDHIRENNYYIFYLEYQYPSDHICIHKDKLEDFRNNFAIYIYPHTTDNDINNNIQHNVTEKLVFL